MSLNGGVWRRERFEPAADARRKQQPVCRQLWTTGRWYPSVAVYYLGSDSRGASLRYGLRSQYSRLSERGNLLPRFRRIQPPSSDHHHLPRHSGHAARAIHQNRCGRDHPLRHHLPESALAQQFVPGSQGEQRRTRPHRGRDADQPHQRQGTVKRLKRGVLAHADLHYRVVSDSNTWGGPCFCFCRQRRPEPSGLVKSWIWLWYIQSPLIHIVYLWNSGCSQPIVWSWWSCSFDLLSGSRCSAQIFNVPPCCNA